MPNSPSVKFTIENNNIEKTTPLVGISCLLARTKKGPYNDPSTVIKSVSQFRDVFGSEIVPDGSPSNIEKALTGGSKLRIIRVPGTGYFKGVLLQTSTDSGPDPESQATPKEVISLAHGGNTVTIGFFTKIGNETVDGAKTFTVHFSKQSNTIFYNITGTGKDIILESNPVITYKNKDTVNRTSVDYLAFGNFLKNSDYLEPVVLSSNLVDKTLNTVLKWLADSVDGSDTELTVKIAAKPLTSLPLDCISQIGSSGKAPAKTDWIASAEYLKDYTDVYQVGCSHIEQHLETPQDQLDVHKVLKTICDETQEYTYYIEVPKYKTHFTQGTEVRTKKEIIEWINTCSGAIGNSMWVAYFAGGIKYYNDDGNLVDSDVLGTICGLGDTASSNYGPWMSFAGLNRGVIYDGQGSSSPNYGSPSRYNDINELANNHANMIIVRDTNHSGKRTVLWNCFTSQVKQDSFKFLSVVRTVLYLKKFLRPIMESYLEEPNIWHTWKSMYLEAKSELDYLVEREAISEYTWLGDQDVSNYKDLTINKESDVRQGRYKVILKFKEVVPLQEISMVLSIDKTSSTISAEVTTD